MSNPKKDISYTQQQNIPSRFLVPIADTDTLKLHGKLRTLGQM